MPRYRRVHTGKPAQTGGITFIPLEQEERRWYSIGKFTVIGFASKKPAGIVIASKHGNRAVDINGLEIPLELCLKNVDGLKNVLENL